MSKAPEEKIKSSFGPVQIPPPKKKAHKKPWEGKLNPNIPQPPFFTGIIGPRHSGKTFLTHHLLSNADGMYQSYFKKCNILLYSPTYEFDKTFHDLQLVHVYQPPTEVTWVVNEVIQQQDDHREADNMAPVLLVLDDITQIKNAWKALERLGYVGRHFDIHCLYIAHKMSSIVRGVRTQTQQWVLFMPHEQSEMEWVLDMFSRRETRLTWIAALSRAWSVDFGFVYIDFERKGYDQIYRKGFNEPLFTPEEQAQMETFRSEKKPIKPEDEEKIENNEDDYAK